MIRKSLNNKNIRFKISLVLSILYAMIIFYLSSRSSFVDSRSVFDFQSLLFPFYIFYNQLDKLAHIFLYAGFGFSLYHTIKSSPNSLLCNHAMLFAVVVGSIYGASDEFHQSFVPGRTASIWDLAADNIGLITAQIVIFIKDNYESKKRHSD